MMYSEQPVIGYAQTCIDGISEFRFETMHGVLQTRHDWKLARYMIGDIRVTLPRRGIGKLLLSSALDHAHDQAAFTVEAPIISREYLASAVQVFGAEHIDIHREGSFRDDDGNVAACERTEAYLYLPLR